MASLYPNPLPYNFAVPSYSDAGLGHMASCGQCDVCKCDTGRGWKSICMFQCPLLHLCLPHDKQTSFLLDPCPRLALLSWYFLSLLSWFLLLTWEDSWTTLVEGSGRHMEETCVVLDETILEHSAPSPLLIHSRCMSKCSQDQRSLAQTGRK